MTHVLRFNPKLTTKDDLEDLKDIDDSDVQISWGSSSNRYIMFCNTKRKSTYGPLYLCKKFTEGTEFQIYNKIKYVITSSYGKKSRKVYMINEEGKLYYRDMATNDIDVYLVKSPRTENKNDWLKPSSGKKFLGLEITEDESIFLLSTLL